MHEVATVILAAGLSRRMGAQDKQLLSVRGRPMIAHMVDLYRRATQGPVLVVTGHARTGVEAALRDSGATTVFCDSYAEGQASSVACGLAHAPDAAALLIGLGDQPLLTAKDLQDLLKAHASAGAEKISIPRHGDARGNPIVVPHSLRPRLTENPRAPGCRRFTQDNPQHVQFHEMAAPGFYRDIDTPEDYQALLTQLEKEDA